MKDFLKSFISRKMIFVAIATIAFFMKYLSGTEWTAIMIGYFLANGAEHISKK